MMAMGKTRLNSISRFKGDSFKRQEFLCKVAQSFASKSDLDTASYFNLQHKFYCIEENKRREDHEGNSETTWSSPRTTNNNVPSNDNCYKFNHELKYDGITCTYCGCFGISDNLRVRIISAKKRARKCKRQRVRRSQSKQKRAVSINNEKKMKGEDSPIFPGVRNSHSTGSNNFPVKGIMHKNKGNRINLLDSFKGPMIQVFCKRCKKTTFENCYVPERLKLNDMPKGQGKRTAELNKTNATDSPTASLSALFRTPKNKQIKTEVILLQSEQMTSSTPISCNRQYQAEVNLSNSLTLSKSAKKKSRSKGKSTLASMFKELSSEDKKKPATANLMTFLSSV